MFQNKKTPSILRIYPKDNIYFWFEKQTIISYSV